MRIGIVTDGLEERQAGNGAQIANGGVGVYIYNLVRNLQEIDRSNEYFLIHRGEGHLDIYHNGRSHNVFTRARMYDHLARVLDLPVARASREFRIDLIHYPNQFGGAFLPRRIKRIVTLHDLTPLMFPRFHKSQTVLGYRLLIRRALRLADHVIVDSPATGNDVVRHGFAAREKVTDVPLGVSAIFKPGTVNEEFIRRYDLPARFILSVGVLEPRKNHRILYQALARIHEEGIRAGLVIVGREGWKWSDPLREPAFAHLRPWVRIFRNVTDRELAEFYKQAEIFVYPSFYEGFGLPVAEAMACGTPAVVSNTSSLPQVAGDAALYADPRDARDFAEKILQILNDSALRQRLSAAGLENVRTLSWKRTAELTLGIFERVVRARNQV